MSTEATHRLIICWRSEVQEVNPTTSENMGTPKAAAAQIITIERPTEAEATKRMYEIIESLKNEQKEEAGTTQNSP